MLASVPVYMDYLTQILVLNSDFVDGHSGTIRYSRVWVVCKGDVAIILTF